MAVTSFKNPGTRVNGTPTGGAENWVNPSWISAIDSSYATANSGVFNRDTKVLAGTNYAFSGDIPSTAVIDGIETRARLLGSKSNSAIRPSTTTQQLIYSGAFRGSNNGAGLYPSTATDVYFPSSGASTYLWGTTWTRTQIISSTFGVGHQARLKGDPESSGISYAYVDGNQIRIYYSTAPVAPSNLVISTLQHNDVDLTWNDNSSDETGFRIERSNNSGSSWSLVTTTAANTTSYQDSVPTEGQKVRYRIRANGSGSLNSNFIGPAVDYYIRCKVPTSVTITNITSNQATITWTDNSTVNINYRIERSTNSGAYVTLTSSLGANATSYVDNGVTEGNNYRYRVTAIGANSNNSSIAYSGTSTAPPISPSGLTLVNRTTSKVDISWNDNSSVEASYDVERKLLPSGSYSVIANLAANTTVYADSTIVPKNSYSYRIRAKHAVVNSGYSNELVVDIPGRSNTRIVFVF